MHKCHTHNLRWLKNLLGGPIEVIGPHFQTRTAFPAGGYGINITLAANHQNFVIEERTMPKVGKRTI